MALEPAGDLGFRAVLGRISLAFSFQPLPVPGCSHQRGGSGRSRPVRWIQTPHCRLDPLLVGGQAALHSCSLASQQTSCFPMPPFLKHCFCFHDKLIHLVFFLPLWATFSSPGGIPLPPPPRLFLKKILSFIYSAVQGLSCHTWDLDIHSTCRMLSCSLGTLRRGTWDRASHPGLKL